jgi:hypothetical protein
LTTIPGQPPHREPNSLLEGRRILCSYEKARKPHLYGTKGRDKAQYMKVFGDTNPAYAVINEKLYWVK